MSDPDWIPVKIPHRRREGTTSYLSSLISHRISFYAAGAITTKLYLGFLLFPSEKLRFILTFLMKIRESWDKYITFSYLILFWKSFVLGHVLFGSPIKFHTNVFFSSNSSSNLYLKSRKEILRYLMQIQDTIYFKILSVHMGWIAAINWPNNFGVVHKLACS